MKRPGRMPLTAPPRPGIRARKAVGALVVAVHALIARGVEAYPVVDWTATYNGPSNSLDFANAVAVDSGDNAVVGGYHTAATGAQWHVRKYSPTGATLWSVSEELVPGNAIQAVTAVAIEPGTDDVFLAGSNLTSTLDWQVHKHSGATGAHVWGAAYGGATKASDYAYAIAVDAAGTVWVGSSNDEVSSPVPRLQDWAICRYDSGGILGAPILGSWVAAPISDVIWGLAVDGVAGIVGVGSWGGGRWRVIRYDTGGGTVWWRADGGDALGVAIDWSGSVYVAGYDAAAPGTDDALAIRKYSAGGSPIWSRTVSVTGSTGTRGFGVKADSCGGVFVAGWASFGTDERRLLAYFRADGQLLWTRTESSAAAGIPERASAVAVDSQGNALVAGVIEYPAGPRANWVTMKYLNPPLAATLTVPQPAASGQWLPVTLEVTNTGATDVTGVAPLIEIVQGSGLVAPLAGPGPAGPVTIASLETVSFTWGTTATGLGLVSFSATAFGTGCPGPVLGAAQVSTTIRAAVLDASLAVPGVVYGVRPFEVAMTVTNTGNCDANAVAPRVETTAGGMADFMRLDGLGSPSIAAGSAATFRWSVTVAGSGAVEFSATGEGTDCMAVTRAGSAVVSATVTGAAFEASVAAYSATPCEGDGFLVTLTVTNTGPGAASLSVEAFGLAGAGLAAQAAGPWPVPPPVLAGGGGVTLTWTFTGASAGTVWMTATAGGTDGDTGVSLAPAAPVGPVSTVLVPGALGVAIAAPRSLQDGQNCTVELTVTNTGESLVTGVSVALDASQWRSGFLSGPSGPVPAGPVNLAGGEARTFRWSFTVTGPGVVVFTGTATGSTCLATNLQASAGTTSYVPAAVSSRLAIDPSTGVSGRWFDAVLSVTNTGGSMVVGVAPSILADSGGSLIVPVAGPVPGGPVVIEGLSSTTFTWTFSVSGCGSVTFTATASGTDGIFLNQLQLGGVATASLKGDPWDPADDGPAGASLLVPAGAAHGPHALCAADNADWYRLPLVEGRAYRVAALSGGGDSYAELFADAAATVMLAADDDSGGALQFAIEGTAAATHDYWLKVRAIPAGSDWAGYVAAREMARASLAVTPSPASVGQAIEVVLTVTNTGDADLDSVTPAIAVTAGAAALSPVSAPGPGSIQAGTWQSFTWVYSVVGDGTVEITASATGVEAGTGIPRTVSGRAVLTALASSSLAASAADGPDPAAAGQWVTIALTVTNTGGAAVNGVTPAIQFNAGGGLLAAQGTVAPAGPVTVGPGAVQTFRWTFSVSGSGSVDYTVTGTGTDAGTGLPVVAPAWGTIAALDPARLEAALALSPAQVQAGTILTAVLTVTNTGGVPATGLTGAIQLDQGAGLAVPASAPAPLASLAAGASASFAWTWSVTGAGAIAATATATGSSAQTGTALAAAGSASVVAAAPARLAARMTAGPDPAVTGQWVLVSLTVTNEGGVAAAGVSPVLGVVAGSGRVVAVAGPAPAGPVTLAPGAAQAFSWSFSASGSGAVVFSATAAGTDAWTSLPVSSVAGAGIAVKGDAWDPGDDTATGGSLLVPPPSWQAHGPHALGGTDAVDWYRAVLAGGRSYRFETAGGSGDVFGQLFADAGGTIVVASDDDGAGGGQFRIDAAAPADGTYYLRASAVPAGGDWNGTLRYRELLAAALDTAEAAPFTGGWLTVTMTVTNSGDSVLSSPSIWMGAVAAGATVVPVSTPSAPASIPSGGSVSLAWTWSVAGAGTVWFSASVSGTDAGTGRTLAAWTKGSRSAAAPAALAASLAVHALPPFYGIVTGSWMEAVMTVWNTGGVAATGVLPVMSAGSGTSIVAAVSGPVPAGPVTIGPGGTQAFTWTWSVCGKGAAAFSATASGIDGVSSLPLAASAWAEFTAASRSILSAVLQMPPAPVVEGDAFNPVFVVTNSGDNPAYVGSVALTFDDRGVAQVIAPLYSTWTSVIPAGASVPFQWRAVALRGGTTTARASFSGQDSTDGAAIAVSAQAALAVVEKFDEELVAWPNPAAWWLNVAVRLTGPADAVQVQVYNSAYKRVAEQEWRNVAQGAGAQLPVYGVANWAPGVYLVRARVTYPGNRVVVLDPVKVAVKR